MNLKTIKAMTEAKTSPTESQNRLILRFLQQGSSITAAQAANYYGIYRLSARIWDLRKQGHAIRSELIVNGSCHYSKYTLIKD